MVAATPSPCRGRASALNSPMVSRTPSPSPLRQAEEATNLRGNVYAQGGHVAPRMGISLPLQGDYEGSYRPQATSAAPASAQAFALSRAGFPAGPGVESTNISWSPAPLVTGAPVLSARSASPTPGQSCPPSPRPAIMHVKLGTAGAPGSAAGTSTTSPQADAQLPATFLQELAAFARPEGQRLAHNMLAGRSVSPMVSASRGRTPPPSASQMPPAPVMGQAAGQNMAWRFGATTPGRPTRINV
ncbi:unnamed protein product [Polarella glacialis]|uniref:Uncharacterized protein n=1 Tax=Polarella glacialis TaxID=89957 RepID=A0A813DEP1_POLGL|nr:unnamed protein product [Polarella glacialis]CAE8714427.1 unnamed protein product [Polarella glacialis]